MLVEAARRRLRDESKGRFKGELLLDDVSRHLYASDASIFELDPLAVAIPRHEEDLQFLVHYAAEQHLALIPRGAGTGLAGEAVGSGIIVDMSVHFRQILETGPDWVCVQPGVVYRHLNDVLAKEGRRFAPDPASGGTCTIGGMLATDASGSRAFLHGYTHDHVEALDVIWDTGDADRVRSARSNGSPEVAVNPTARLTELGRALEELLQGNRELLESYQLGTCWNRCGYPLHRVLTPGGVDWCRMLVGSEGTLGIFTQAVLRTIPLPEGRAALLLGFVTLDSALRAIPFARKTKPSACELMDRRLLTLARGQSAHTAKIIPATAEAVMLVEFERESDADARSAVLELIDILQKRERLALLALPALDDDAIARLWQVRDVAMPSLYAIGTGSRPLAFVEDAAVPPDRLPDFLAQLQVILQRFETTSSFLIHAATGQIHTRPFLDLSNPDDQAKLWPLADAIHSLTIEMGGTISSQHGTGMARTPWVEKQYGPLFPLFREVKRIFDPRGIFNPGKIVGLDPSKPAWNLRTEVLAAKPEVLAVAPKPTGSSAEIELEAEARSANRYSLRWQPDELARNITSCNGCGDCRTEEPKRRMCPMFRITHDEAATPRAKANLLRHLLGPAGDPKLVSASEVRDVAELCINCKMCAHECSAHVNVPKMMLEAKAAHQAEHGLDRSDWVLARIESFAALGGNFALTTNALLRSRVVRWVLQSVFGISRHRRLPTFAARSFLKRAKRRGLSNKHRGKFGDRGFQFTHPTKVAYFVDTFANYIDPLIAEAMVAVLHHHGIDVYVPPGQVGCGVAPLARGDVETAQESMTHNLRIFADLAREGYTILCSEPTAALIHRQDALDVIDDRDAKLVAERTTELTAFLWQLHENGQLRTDFQPLNFSVGHHVPCHVKALGLGIHGPALLQLIPQLRVHTIDVSCSGMAGTFGLKAKNFANSLAAGKPMLDELSRPLTLYGSTECSSCRMQMEQGTNKRTLHPIQYLALAYGLLPEVGRKLRSI
jgi:FAD/FMN-containing dehydrogenase/Fe-S oxidoreductase